MLTKLKRFLGLAGEIKTEVNNHDEKIKTEVNNHDEKIKTEVNIHDEKIKTEVNGLDHEMKTKANPIKPEKDESSQQEVEKVAEKPKIGYIHLSGCTGDAISLTENYDILAELLTNMVDIVYGQTLVDVWYDDGVNNNPNMVEDMPEMDLALVEGSVCLQDEHSIHELKKLREKAKLVCAYGSCAANGCFTRYSRGGQQAQPKHEAFLPIGDIVQVDLAIPGCPVSPEIVAKTVVALINEDMEYLQPMLNMAGCSASCGCDLQKDIVNKSLCTGCGTCAMACQTRAIGMREGRPDVNIDRCIKCGICYTHCPRSWFPAERIKADLGL